ncbi:MAG TPA: hypothetical protein ACFCUC_12465 [Desulfobacterales bacterium]
MRKKRHGCVDNPIREDEMKIKFFAFGKPSNPKPKLVRPLRRKFDRNPFGFAMDRFADPGRGVAEPPLEMHWNTVTRAYEFKSGRSFHQEGKQKNA